MVNLNGHDTGNVGNSEGDTYGNSPFLDPTSEKSFLKSLPQRWVLDSFRKAKFEY